jgi:hypothetical protein
MLVLGVRIFDRSNGVRQSAPDFGQNGHRVRYDGGGCDGQLLPLAGAFKA